MIRLLAALFLLLLALPATADEAGDALATRVARACGVDAWPDVEQVGFTWSHHPSDTERSYVWTPGENRVVMTSGDRSVDLDMDVVEGDELEKAHSAFVNDHYWMLFEHRLAWDDGVEFSDLGTQPVPGFDDLGERRALRVHYTGDAGYTPGDAYVLYLDDDDRSVAWAFHRGGADEPSLVTTRQDWATSGGIHHPTRFLTADGETFISISDVEVVRSAH